MGLGIFYFIIIILANTIGAISGMGGGVIIKPALDLVAQSPLSAINFYSSFAVFVMAIVSTAKQIKGGARVNVARTVALSLSAIVGGRLGDATFRLLSSWFAAHQVNLIQIILTLITLIWALRYAEPRAEAFKVRYPQVVDIAVGLILGWLATLLGIGGGPINVALLVFCFNFDIKMATVYSIVIIFFSQLSKLASALPHLAQDHVELTLLPFILGAAICGGFLGASLNRKFSERAVLRLYRIVVVSVIVLNAFNGVRLLIG